MDSTAPVGTTPQPVGHDEAAARLAVVLNGHSGSPRPCRVEAPDRVLRMWTLLNTADDELHQAKLSPGAAARLERQLRVITTELERSVSPVLADELHHLIGQGRNASPTLAELRVDYASVLGWTGGLVIAMLDQLATTRLAPARLAVPGVASSS
jgi:hypothetical protein